jgi:integrase/recombinase XerD
MRINEVEKLTPEDIKKESGYIIIKDDKCRQDRLVPLTDYSRELVKCYLENTSADRLVFAHGAKRTLNSWMNNRLKSLCKKLELPQLSCHSIRHIVGTHLLKKGADIREVQVYLGHERIKNTEIYTRIYPDDLKEILSKSHPREVNNVINQSK